MPEPLVGAVYRDTYYQDEVTITRVTCTCVEIVYPDSVPIVFTKKRWARLLEEGIYAV